MDILKRSNGTAGGKKEAKFFAVTVVQSLSQVWLLVTPRSAVHQAPLSSPISWSLLKFTESVTLSNHFILCCPLLLLPSIFPRWKQSFSMSWIFTSGGETIGASVTVLPMNIQDWFPLGLTGLISLQSKRLSRVFSSIVIWKHQFFSTYPSL